MTGRLAVARAVSGLQAAALDGRTRDIAMILAGLDAEQLRNVATTLAADWLNVVNLSGYRPGLREAIGDDAMRLALLDDSAGTP